MPVMREQEGRRSRTTVGVVSLLLVALGVTALVLGVRGQAGGEEPPAPPPVAEMAESEDATRADPEVGNEAADPRSQAGPGLDYSRPVRIRIPTIGVDSSLVELGLDPAGAMETPAEVEKAGWFRPSPPPGVPGATVIAGHVTWDQRPVVFFELSSLRPGDRVQILREDGITTVFAVTRVGSFAKDSFPTDDVYDQPKGSELRLITCGGEYDAENRRYLDNVIVWARLVDVRR